MHLELQNYVVGLASFWNLTAPAVALVVFLIGFLGVCVARRPHAARIGLVVTVAGIAAFVVAGAVDGARNAHDLHELGSAVHERYGLVITDVDAAGLLDSSDRGHALLAGRAVTTFGLVALDVHGEDVSVSLDGRADGTFVLATDGHELDQDR